MKVNCKRCGREWHPYLSINSGIPKKCPKCNSLYWNYDKLPYTYTKIGIKTNAGYPKTVEGDRQRQREYIAKKKRLCIERYSDGKFECICCGEKIYEFLTIDHSNNDGAEHRRKDKLRSGTMMYHWLIKNNFPKGFKVMCFNCNLAKGFFGECPHKKVKREVLLTK